MGYSLVRTSSTFANKDNQDWLGSAHGVNTADSVTLDAASFLTAYPSGEVPSGVHISKRTSDGKYRPFLAANTTDTDRGFLLHGVLVTTGVDQIGALLWHGEVVTAKVPLGVGQVAPVAASVPFIRLV